MAKKTKQQRQERRQQIVRNIRMFIQEHDDKVLPVIKTIVERRFPVASSIIEAIREAKESKLPADTKKMTIEHLQELLEVTEEDEENSQSELVNSTKIAKFISPVNLVLSSITFFGAMITEILHYWGVLPNRVDPVIITTLAAIYGSMHGVNIWQRSELKKKAIELK